MQDRYVGDIGDFAKYALLRALSVDRRLGVAWYLYPNEKNTGDGRHTKYLKQRDVWRDLDKIVFDGLDRLIRENRRSVAEVKSEGLLPGAVFADQRLQTDLPSHAWAKRREWRAEWFQQVQQKLSHSRCDIVFADPDNGLCLDSNYSASRQKDQKRLPLSEALRLSDGRPIIIYHHNSRFLGGHHQEIQYWMERLPSCTHAFYWRVTSPRTFFAINSDQLTVERLTAFANKWQRAGELIERDCP